MILNPTTARWRDAFIKRPVSTLIIQTGGDSATALKIIQEIHDSLVLGNNNPLNLLSFEEKKSIGIDDVRDIQKNLSLKANKTDGVSRILAIESAERVTPEAQNALLKLIEELPKSTIIILLVNDKNSLLPTVQSRCFMLPILPITEEQATTYGQELGHTKEKIIQTFIMSEGRVSDFKQLLENPDNKLFIDIATAKNFLKASVIERQKCLSDIHKSDSSKNFLRALILVAKSGMRLSKTTEAKNQWKKVLRVALTSNEQLNSNVNTKLVMLNLSVSLP